MSLRRIALALLTVALIAAPTFAQQTGKVTGVVIDEFNALTLPMAPVEVMESGEIVYTELDGKYSVDAPAGHLSAQGELRRLSGAGRFRHRRRRADGQMLDIPISMERFTEEVTVTAEAETPQLFTAEAQLVERRRAAVITDNLAAEDMRNNADSDAASGHAAGHRR